MISTRTALIILLGLFVFSLGMLVARIGFSDERLMLIVIYSLIAGLTSAVAYRHGQYQGRRLERRAILNWLLHGNSPNDMMKVIEGIKRGDHQK